MSASSRCISMHELEYSLTLSRPCRRSTHAFSIVLVGNQIADFVLLGLSLVTGRGARRSSGYARAGLPGRAARSCLPPSGCGRRYVLMTSARLSSWATACIPVVNAVISTGAGTCELVRLRPWCAAPEKGSRQILPNRRARVRCGLPRWRTASLSVSCRPGRCLRPRAGRGIP